MTGLRSHRAKGHAPREWALRGALALLLATMGYVSTMQTLGFTLAKSNADRAHELSPGDGRIAGELAARRITENVTSAQRAEIDRLARQALVDEPLSVPALTARAINADLRGDLRSARELFLHSDKLSRRELGVRLWLIEDAVARTDIRDALRHYDIALRTSKNAPALLFPVLASAIGDPAISQALGDTMRARPPWSEAFFDFVAGSGASPVAAASLFSRLSRQGVEPPASARARIIETLVGAGDFDTAWSFYKTLRGDVDRTRSRDRTFNSIASIPTFFDWTSKMDDPGLTASIGSDAQGGTFEFSAPSTLGGIVLQQGQFLPPGTYRLEGVSANLATSIDARPYWQLSCLDNRELGRVDVPDSTYNRGRYSGTFEVDAACPVQMLRLIVRPTTEIGGVSGQIRQAMLSLSRLPE